MRIIGGGGEKKEYERVVTDEWLTGVIADVQLQDRPYTRTNKETGEETITDEPHVRFKFTFEGYKFPHYSRWLYASTNEMSNLYKNFLRFLCLVHDCKDHEIDLDRLIGAKVKVMWVNSGDYQNIAQIRGLNETLDIRRSEV